LRGDVSAALRIGAIAGLLTVALGLGLPKELRWVSKLGLAVIAATPSSALLLLAARSLANRDRSTGALALLTLLAILLSATLSLRG